MKIALTIAGSDPTAGAGLQADIRVFTHFGVYALSAVSALTAQNTFEVRSTRAVEGRFLEEQLSTLLSDIRPDALKTGMLFSGDAVRTVAKIVRGFDLDNLVIDPVTISSTGTSLFENGALNVLREELFPLARVITPNIYEASALSGIPIEGEEDMEKAAAELKKLGPEIVIITGGHLHNETVDILFDGGKFHHLRSKKIKGDYHGTGCAFSAALTALLARGNPALEAARQAKDFVETAIRTALTIGKGMKVLRV